MNVTIQVPAGTKALTINVVFETPSRSDWYSLTDDEWFAMEDSDFFAMKD